MGLPPATAPTTAASGASSKVFDEYTREYLAWYVARQLTAADLITVMEGRVAQRRVPAHLRGDNGSEFVALVLQTWLAERPMKTLSIEPGSLWQNGHVESFHGLLRDRVVWTVNLMLSVAKDRVVIKVYQRHYHEELPHGGLDNCPQGTRAKKLGLMTPKN